MKRLTAIFLIMILCLSLCVGLTGCDKPSVAVKSVLDINGSFSGKRTVTVVYPSSVNIEALNQKLVEDSPTADIDGAEFSYIGVQEEGFCFELSLNFENKQKYEEIISDLIGRSAEVFLSQKNTALTKGTRMEEDFDVSELIAWIVRDTAAEKATSGMDFSYSANLVRIANQEYETGSTAKVNDCKGSRISTISVKTSNDKEGNFNRTFTFTLPNDTYLHDREAIEQYFLTNTSPDAKYSGWSPEGSNMIYTVIYEGLDRENLVKLTAMLLDTDSVDIFYGDRDNASTPLSEGMAYEESLDTFSFIGPDEGFPKLEYSYSLPTSTTHGDGSVFEDGKWVTKGAWEEGVYKLSLDTGAVRVRVPDGIQYAINGINFYLTSLGNSRFRRTTDFLYSKTDGHDGMIYANSYFLKKGADSSVTEDEENLICRVNCEGTAEEITDMLVKLFGSGNFMAYRSREGLMALTVKTELSDYVNLGYMLNSGNANRPMTYYVSSEGGENIVSVSVDGAETAYVERGANSLPIKNGTATVEYHGNIPITSHIIIYILVGVSLLGLTSVVAIMLVKPKRRRKPAPDPLNNPEAFTDLPFDDNDRLDKAEKVDYSDDSEEEKPAALDQTTTFSIFELGALARNKKYVDEINREVEERIRQDNLQNRKNDIRAKELEDLSRKVYGDGSEGDESGTDTVRAPETAETSAEPVISEQQPEAPAKPDTDSEVTTDEADRL